MNSTSSIGKTRLSLTWTEFSHELHVLELELQGKICLRSFSIPTTILEVIVETLNPLEAIFHFLNIFRWSCLSSVTL